MYILFLIKGFLIGVSAAMVPGPMSLLCISKTLEKGRLSGLACGLGISTADCIYSILVGFGLAFISGFILDLTFILRVIGGVVLIYLGIKFYKTKISKKKEIGEANSLFKDYLVILGLTLSNPTTIIFFTSVFASIMVGLDFKDSDSTIVTLMIVLGVFLGSLCWWIVLLELACRAKHLLKEKYLNYLSKTAGLIIIFFGISVLFDVIL